MITASKLVTGVSAVGFALTAHAAQAQQRVQRTPTPAITLGGNTTSNLIDLTATAAASRVASAQTATRLSTGGAVDLQQSAGTSVAIGDFSRAPVQASRGGSTAFALPTISFQNPNGVNQGTFTFTAAASQIGAAQISTDRSVASGVRAGNGSFQSFSIGTFNTVTLAP